MGAGNLILSGIVWSYIGVFLQSILKVTSLAIVARLIEPKEFGLLSYALICTGVIERLGQLGVGSALVQRKYLSHKTTYVARKLNIVLGGLTASGVFLCADLFAEFFEQPALCNILRILSLGCFLESCAVVPDALLQRKLAFRRIVSADNASYLIGMVILCPVLAWQGFGVWALVLSLLLMKLVRLVFLHLAAPARGMIGTFDILKAKELLGLGLGYSLARILNCISLQGDNFVVGKMFGVDMLGLYTRGYQLMTLPAALLGQVYERVMFPAMSKSQDDSPSLNEQFVISIEAMTILTLPAGLILSLCSFEFVSTVFGHRWLDVVPIVSALSYGVFFRATYKCSDTAVRAVGAVYRYALRQAVYSASVLVGAVVGAYTHGSIGVAWGVVCAVAINYLSLTLLARSLLRTPWSALLLAHIPGFVLFVWCWLALTLYLPYIRVGEIGSVGEVILCFLGVSVIWVSGFFVVYMLSLGRVARVSIDFVKSMIFERRRRNSLGSV
jgi:O-antigen/teichoic acid export membrane protein